MISTQDTQIAIGMILYQIVLLALLCLASWAEWFSTLDQSLKGLGFRVKGLGLGFIGLGLFMMPYSHHFQILIQQLPPGCEEAASRSLAMMRMRQSLCSQQGPHMGLCGLFINKILDSYYKYVQSRDLGCAHPSLQDLSWAGLTQP